MTNRRTFSDQFKAAVALEALRGGKTMQGVAAKQQLHPAQVARGNARPIEGLAAGFTEKKIVLKNKTTSHNGLTKYTILISLNKKTTKYTTNL